MNDLQIIEELVKENFPHYTLKGVKRLAKRHFNEWENVKENYEGEVKSYVEEVEYNRDWLV